MAAADPDSKSLRSNTNVSSIIIMFMSSGKKKRRTTFNFNYWNISQMKFHMYMQNQQMALLEKRDKNVF